MATNNEIHVGTIVRAKVRTAVCDVDERGVCYDEYTFAGRRSWSFIFESGRYDGFSPAEVAAMLEVTDEFCASLAGYRFKNETNLSMDFWDGVFAAAFSQER